MRHLLNVMKNMLSEHVGFHVHRIARLLARKRCLLDSCGDHGYPERIAMRLHDRQTDTVHRDGPFRDEVPGDLGRSLLTVDEVMRLVEGLDLGCLLKQEPA